jgi:hypothetical protein
MDLVGHIRFGMMYAQVGHGQLANGRLRGKDFCDLEVTAEPPPAPPPRSLQQPRLRV